MCTKSTAVLSASLYHLGFPTRTLGGFAASRAPAKDREDNAADFSGSCGYNHRHLCADLFRELPGLWEGDSIGCATQLHALTSAAYSASLACRNTVHCCPPQLLAGSPDPLSIDGQTLATSHHFTSSFASFLGESYPKMLPAWGQIQVNCRMLQYLLYLGAIMIGM